VEINWADLGFVDEIGDIDRSGSFDVGLLKIRVTQRDVFAIVLIAFDNLAPRYFLAGLGIDAPIAHRRKIAPIEHVQIELVGRGRGIESDRNIDQTEVYRASPNGSRCWFGIAPRTRFPLRFFTSCHGYTRVTEI